MRRLIFIPIVHTLSDLGSYAKQAQEGFIARYGLPKWRQHLRDISELWETISKKLELLPWDSLVVKLYQDGLPLCGRELEIVTELAEKENVNHSLLLHLTRLGATVVGTEEPQLLLREREKLLSSSPREISLYDDLMKARDDFIAKRIDSTLLAGELGILFMGALHKVTERLPKDIQVQNLLQERQNA